MMPNDTFVGWQDPPNQRGTFDILKVCSITIFLLCWSSVCPNVPNATGSSYGRFNSKLLLFGLALLGPEWIFVLAGGQFNAAYRDKKAFKDNGYPGWTLRHTFFVNMGGLHLCFPDREAAGEPTFPVDCHQLLILAERKYIEMPKISEEDIKDRNKSDSLARVIAVIQSLWFTADCLGRFAQGLSVSTLELTTLGFVFMMTATSICWWRKPMDVTRPITLQVQADLISILHETNAPVPIRGRLPLTYLSRREWFMTQFWSCYKQALRSLRLIPRNQRAPGQATHFASVDFPELDLIWELIFAPLIALYSAIFLVAWNFHFPTNAERTLWRASSAYTMAYGVAAVAVAGCYHQSPLFGRYLSKFIRFVTLRDAAPSPRALPKHEKKPDKGKGFFAKFHAFCDKLRNLSPDKDPAFTIPLRWLAPATILNFVYLVSRLYILTEDIIEMRRLPLSAYQTVNYGPYSPIL